MRMRISNNTSIAISLVQIKINLLKQIVQFEHHLERHDYPSRLSPMKSLGSPLENAKSPRTACRGSLGSCIFQGLPKTPRAVPKIFKNLNFSGDSNGGFLESPDNTHQLPAESLGSPRVPS